MEGTANPRITCAYLNSYVGKNVIVVGKVLELRGEDALIDADGNITAHLNRVSSALPLTYPRLFPPAPSFRPVTWSEMSPGGGDERDRRRATAELATAWAGRGTALTESGQSKRPN
jgi:hypothetical protein